MRLLVVAQKVNIEDHVLGFFHWWLEEFAKHCQSIIVICLEKGEYDLPSNVKVLSLGKDDGQSRLKYVLNFYKYIWQEKKNYDAVFVHMNQEYVLLAGWWWRLIGKKVFMWRNHHAGNWLTDLAAFFCHKVFCTSKFSYTAKYKKTVLMPVGIDTGLFKPNSKVKRTPKSILFLARMSPVKKPDVLVSALRILAKQNVEFTASFYGDPAPIDIPYYKRLVEQVKLAGLYNQVRFYQGIPNHQTPAIYSSHDIFINLSSSGMYDKTIFEAMASGCVVLVANKNLKGLIDDMFLVRDLCPDSLADKLEQLIDLNREVRDMLVEKLKILVDEKHSLERLALELFKVILSEHER